MSKVIAIAIDNEFTHYDKIGGDLIACGMVEILEGYQLGREKLFYSRPESTKYFTKSAQEIHKISLFKAMTFPTRHECCNSIVKWLEPIGNQMPLIFHANGDLDPAWLRAHFDKENRGHELGKYFAINGNESTLKMSRKYLKQLPNHKLPTVSEHYGIELNHHDALSDARACASIYCHIMKKDKIWTGELDL